MLWVISIAANNIGDEEAKAIDKLNNLTELQLSNVLRYKYRQ